MELRCRACTGRAAHQVPHQRARQGEKQRHSGTGLLRARCDGPGHDRQHRLRSRRPGVRREEGQGRVGQRRHLHQGFALHRHGLRRRMGDHHRRPRQPLLLQCLGQRNRPDRVQRQTQAPCAQPGTQCAERTQHRPPTDAERHLPAGQPLHEVHTADDRQHAGTRRAGDSADRTPLPGLHAPQLPQAPLLRRLPHAGTESRRPDRLSQAAAAEPRHDERGIGRPLAEPRAADPERRRLTGEDARPQPQPEDHTALHLPLLRYGEHGREVRQHRRDALSGAILLLLRRQQPQDARPQPEPQALHPLVRPQPAAQPRREPQPRPLQRQRALQLHGLRHASLAGQLVRVLPRAEPDGAERHLQGGRCHRPQQPRAPREDDHAGQALPCPEEGPDEARRAGRHLL